MKVQANDSTAQASSKSNKTKFNKDNLPKKKWITDSAIKNKLDSHVETSRSSHQVRVAASEVASEKNPELPETSLMKTDVQKNDPNDSTTTEKLKSVLSRGGFSFSPQERENLERILGKS